MPESGPPLPVGRNIDVLLSRDSRGNRTPLSQWLERDGNAAAIVLNNVGAVGDRPRYRVWER